MRAVAAFLFASLAVPAAPLLAWQVDDRCYTAELFGETGDHHSLVTALLRIATTLQRSGRAD